MSISLHKAYNKDINSFNSTMRSDKGLAEKRRLLTYISLVVLLIVFSGASIEKANTFLFEIHFSNPSGILYFLTLANLFCLIRYLNYAFKYLEDLKFFWIKEFLDDYRLHSYNSEDGDVYGFFSTSYSKNFSEIEDTLASNDVFETIKYHTGWFLNRSISYSKSEDKGITYRRVEISIIKSLGFLNYIKFLSIEMSYRFKAAFKRNETFDLFAPIILFLFSTFSVYFSLIIEFYILILKITFKTIN